MMLKIINNTSKHLQSQILLVFDLTSIIHPLCDPPRCFVSLVTRTNDADNCKKTRVNAQE
jgi:hypothetical protein